PPSRSGKRGAQLWRDAQRHRGPQSNRAGVAESVARDASAKLSPPHVCGIRESSRVAAAMTAVNIEELSKEGLIEQTAARLSPQLKAEYYRILRYLQSCRKTMKCSWFSTRYKSCSHSRSM